MIKQRLLPSDIVLVIRSFVGPTSNEEDNDSTLILLESLFTTSSPAKVDAVRTQCSTFECSKDETFVANEKYPQSYPTDKLNNTSEQKLTQHQRFKSSRGIVPLNPVETGIEFFNKKPTHGLRYLIDSGTIGDSPKEIATFLFDNEKLDKLKIGEILGSDDEFSDHLRKEFSDLQSFAGMEFDEALRFFLTKFHLPKEAQQIDRLLQTFGTKYYDENPSGLFENADAAYVFAYSAMLLNTDLHSHSLRNRKRMSLNQFVRNNSGMNGGKDYPLHFQAKIYNSIKNEEMTCKKTPHRSAKKQLRGKKKSNKKYPIKQMRQGLYRMFIVISLIQTNL